MRKFGLIGFPLGHSFSKLFFTNKFISESIHDCVYDNYELEELKLLHDLIIDNPEICGLNVTIPHKSEVLKYLNSVDEEAKRVGAVNVLKISRGSGTFHIKGFNTDIHGFKEALIPNINPRIPKKALILGTGGSSKAVAYILKELDFGIIHVSRMPGEDCIAYDQLTDEMIFENKLIINTTPLGMFPHIQNKPAINYNCLTKDHILFDLVYNPTLTAFLKQGMSKGCKIIGGLNMLHLQAEKSWEIWNDPVV